MYHAQTTLTMFIEYIRIHATQTLIIFYKPETIMAALTKCKAQYCLV